jgi:hypothetical protein
MISFSFPCTHVHVQVELQTSRKVSTRDIRLGMTPRHLVFHERSRSILVSLSPVHAIRYHAGNFNPWLNLDRSEIRMVDFHTGAEACRHRLEKDESAISMHLWTPSDEDLTVVSTSIRSDGSKTSDSFVCSDNGEPCGRQVINPSRSFLSSLIFSFSDSFLIGFLYFSLWYFQGETSDIRVNTSVLAMSSLEFPVRFNF